MMVWLEKMSNFNFETGAMVKRFERLKRLAWLKWLTWLKSLTWMTKKQNNYPMCNITQCIVISDQLSTVADLWGRVLQITRRSSPGISATRSSPPPEKRPWVANAIIFLAPALVSNRTALSRVPPVSTISSTIIHNALQQNKNEITCMYQKQK